MNNELKLNLFTRRNVLFFVMALSLSMGFTLRLPALVFLGEFLAVLLLVSWFVSSKILNTIELKRSHQEHLFEGSILHVKLSMMHRHWCPLFMMEITEEFPPGDHYYIRNTIDQVYFKDRVLNLDYSALCNRRRGLYFLGPLRMNVGEPLGIFYQSTSIGLLTPLYLLPKSQSIDAMQLLSEGTLPHAGEETRSIQGQSEVFYNMREYRWGDHPRLIHWPTTARRDRMIVREMEDHIKTDVNLFLDLRKIASRGLGEVSTAELIIKTAASIVETSIEKSHRVQLFAITDELVHVPLNEGKAHFYNILEKLTLLQSKGNANFEKLMHQGLGWALPGSTVILSISGTVFNLEWLDPILPGLLADQIQVIIILVDDHDLLKIYREQDDIITPFVSIDQKIRILKEMGCIVYKIDREADLTTQLSFPA